MDAGRNPFLRFLNKGAEIALAYVGRDDHKPSALLSPNLGKAIDDLKIGQCPQRNGDPVFKHDRERAELVEIVARSILEAHDNIETAIALEHQSCWPPAERDSNRLCHFLDGQTIARDGRAIEGDVQRRKAGHLLHLHVRGAFDTLFSTERRPDSERKLRSGTAEKLMKTAAQRMRLLAVGRAFAAWVDMADERRARQVVARRLQQPQLTGPPSRSC